VGDLVVVADEGVEDGLLAAVQRVRAAFGGEGDLAGETHLPAFGVLAALTTRGDHGDL
jgi:hypothetical protein